MSLLNVLSDAESYKRNTFNISVSIKSSINVGKDPLLIQFFPDYPTDILFHTVYMMQFLGPHKALGFFVKHTSSSAISHHPVLHYYLQQIRRNSD